MKIFEIIEPEDKITPVNTKWDIDRLERNRDKLIISKPEAGADSLGYKTKDPFLYGKKSHVPVNLEADGFYQYVQSIKPIIKENPYAPRIYVTNILVDKNGMGRPKYTMEKLTSGQSLSKEIIHAMGTRTFQSEDWYKATGESISIEQLTSEDLWKILCKTIEIYLNSYPAKPSTLSTLYPIAIDDKLKELLHIIKMVVIKNEYIIIDYIHANNVMARGYGSGFQVVLTDPLISKYDVPAKPIDRS
jgi:hypothetical protein